MFRQPTADGVAKEANDEFEKMSKEPNQDEINVISAFEDVPTLNVDEQMLEEESVVYKAEVPSEEACRKHKNVLDFCQLNRLKSRKKI